MTGDFEPAGPRLKRWLGSKEEGHESLGAIRNSKRLCAEDSEVLYQVEIMDCCTVGINCGHLFTGSIGKKLPTISEGLESSANCNFMPHHKNSHIMIVPPYRK